MTEILDIVNDKDQVVGQEERSKVHRLGLTCRIIYVWFYTMDGRLILQKRSMSKESNPGRYTATVSGHVTAGQTYEQAAVREILEEAGVSVKPSEIKLIEVYHSRHVLRDDYISDAFRAAYAYKFTGDVADLKIEDGEGDGFVAMTFEELDEQADQAPEKFVGLLIDEKGRQILKKIEQLA